MYKEITTVEAAFKARGIEYIMPDLSMIPERISKGMIALFMLQVIVEAVNNDDAAQPEWKADYNNSNQYKWFPWYRGGDETGSGFSFVATNYGWSYTYTYGGARLALKDEERAEHMNEFFKDLYKEFWLILK